jgi:hypothetical protein
MVAFASSARPRTSAAMVALPNRLQLHVVYGYAALQQGGGNARLKAE